MKRMLFNATHAEELRVAIVDGQKLLDLDIESTARNERKGNIYKAVITKVEPSLEAAFVNYGVDRHGFLPLKEIYRAYFRNHDAHTAISSVKIDAVIEEGMEMIVQVDKDERGTKGAALTTFISLAGRFVVLMPNNPKAGGISRRILGDDRAELRDALADLEIESEHAIIARTAGIGRSRAELQWDLDFLNKLWNSIEQAATNRKAPFLIYQESNLTVRMIRDHLGSDITEIIIDDAEIYQRARRFMDQVMPHSPTRLKLYNDTIPLFSRYQIENQIESAFNREVSLPSGGSIMIDHTEALISIDVNSARATKGSDIEETAFETNLQAVEEVARQLRIRDIGGLVVIDLIDMVAGKNQRAVETKLRDSLHPDRAKVQIGKISRFGLLQMSRQRLRSSISDVNYVSCPRCSGTGTIRNVVSASLNLLRLIEDEALKENTEAIQVSLPLDMATYLLNEKRHELNQMETKLASRVIIIPDDSLSSPHFELRRLRSEELGMINDVPSYQQKIESDKPKVDLTASLKTPKPIKPSIETDQISHTAPPAPAVATAKPASSGGLISRIARTLFDAAPTDSANQQPAQARRDNHNIERDYSDDDGNRRGGLRGRGNRGGRGRRERNDRDDNQQNRQGQAANRQSRPPRNNANLQPESRGRGRNQQAQNQPRTQPSWQDSQPNRGGELPQNVDGSNVGNRNRAQNYSQNRPHRPSRGRNQNPAEASNRAPRRNPNSDNIRPEVDGNVNLANQRGNRQNPGWGESGDI